MSEVGKMNEIIKEFIFSEKLSDEEKKTRFEIAWDIWKSFDIIKSNLEAEIIKRLYKAAKESNEFVNYVVLRALEQRTIWIFKPEWTIEVRIPILSYAITLAGVEHRSILIGLRKYREEFPFTGSLTEKDLPQDIKTSLDGLFDSLFRKKQYSPVYITRLQHHWIAASEFFLDDSLYGDLAEKGIEEVLEQWMSEMMDLKRETEKAVDEFIMAYKAQM